MLAAAKYIGAGLACSGLIGAGAGIGLIFSATKVYFKSYYLIIAYFYASLKGYVFLMINMLDTVKN